MRALLLFCFLAWGAGAHAVVDILEFSSPEEEQRYKRLTKELRCTVCQNQNIADSNAELAADLRRKTYELVRSGKSEGEIKDYMVDRYGNFVLYQPPLNAGTLVLWIGPFLVAAVGGFVLIRALQRRRAGKAEAAVVARERLQRAESLLRDNDAEGRP